MKLKSKLKQYSKVLLAFTLLSLPCVVNAAPDSDNKVFNFDMTSSNDSGLTQVGKKFGWLANTAFYGMYLVGGVLLTSGAMKLKQGDIPGFAKTAAGGGVMFTIPTIMSSLKDYSQK